MTSSYTRIMITYRSFEFYSRKFYVFLSCSLRGDRRWKRLPDNRKSSEFPVSIHEVGPKLSFSTLTIEHTHSLFFATQILLG